MHTGRTSKRTLRQALDYIHSVSDNILNASVWISWSKPHKPKWTAEDYFAQPIWKIFVLNKIWKPDKKNSWYLSLLRKLDLHFIFGSKAEANCSIRIKLVCQLLVSSLQAMLKKNSTFSEATFGCVQDMKIWTWVSSVAQLLMTVAIVKSILALSYEIMLCFSYLLEIMVKFKVPQQVKQSLVCI